MPLEQFGDDPGTLWLEPTRDPMKLAEVQQEPRWAKRIRRLLGRKPLIWFVDDEASNRAWFAKHHQRHFGVLTFSSRDHCQHALSLQTPCDVVVTDIFFPAKQPATDAEADHLLTIYARINDTAVRDLPRLWNEVRGAWHLDGFDVARDVTTYAADRGEQIPVLLFSRKATLLLNREDWLDDPPAAVENTLWLLEKLDASIDGEPARKAASIQRERIVAALRYRQKAAPWWMKQLRRFGIRCGPLSYSLSELGST